MAWGGKSTLTDWAGNQQWILTPQRLVGVLEIEPLSDQEAYSIHGRIRFGLEEADRAQGRRAASNTARWFAASTNTTTRT